MEEHLHQWKVCQLPVDLLKSDDLLQTFRHASRVLSAVDRVHYGSQVMLATLVLRTFWLSVLI